MKQNSERYRQAMDRIYACRRQLDEISEIRRKGKLALKGFQSKYEPRQKEQMRDDQ